MKHTRLLITTLAALSLSAFAQDADVATIELKPHAQNPLGYDKTELTVKAGQKVKLTLNNTGSIAPQPHNFLLVKPGKLDAVGALANAMLADPQGMAKSYIPEAAKPDLLANTKLVSRTRPRRSSSPLLPRLETILTSAPSPATGC
jgi:hypothetical protein